MGLVSPRNDCCITQRNNSSALLAWLACLLVCLLGLFGPFVALAVRGPGFADRGEMEEERASPRLMPHDSHHRI